MINKLLSYLTGCYSKNSSNKSYAVIIRALQRVGGVPTLQNLIMALVSATAVKTEDIPEERGKEILDYRIYNLSVKSLRKLQAPLGADEFVGISFVQERKKFGTNKKEYSPVSCLLLGPNGIGKTSLFCSLEMAALGFSNIATNHGYETSEGQRKFLSHNDGSVNPEIRLYTKAGILNATIDRSSASGSLHLPQAFLCSSYDISILEKGEINRDYLMNQMGKPEFITLLSVLRNVSEVISFLEEYKVAYELLLDEKKDSNEGASLQERKDSFEKQIKKKLGMRLLREALNRLNASDYKKLKEEVDAIIKDVETEIEHISKVLLSVSKHIIPNILKDFLDDCKLDIKMDKGIPAISLRVGNYDDKNAIPIEPRQFFNTFRLKLFAIALKISMSCCVKIIDKVNFPFVIDDTFDASDFINKGEIKNFIGNILSNHDEIKALENYPLQLIIFTQDDIIAQKAYQGLVNHTSLEDFKPKFLKVYDCKEAVQDDFIAEKFNGEEITYFNIADDIIGKPSANINEH